MIDAHDTNHHLEAHLLAIPHLLHQENNPFGELS